MALTIPPALRSCPAIAFEIQPAPAPQCSPVERKSRCTASWCLRRPRRCLCFPRRSHRCRQLQSLCQKRRQRWRSPYRALAGTRRYRSHSGQPRPFLMDCCPNTPIVPPRRTCQVPHPCYTRPIAPEPGEAVSPAHSFKNLCSCPTLRRSCRWYHRRPCRCRCCHRHRCSCRSHR